MRTLYVNLSTNEIRIKPVSEEMKMKFIGGKGFDLWLLWNSLPWDKTVKWDDPENEVCLACGPLGGTPVYPGSGKTIVVSISPLTGSVIDSNMGGYFGPYLKFSGFDAIEIQGKAEEEVIIVVDGPNARVFIEKVDPDLPNDAHLMADMLHEKYGEGDKHSVAVVNTGPAAEHVLFGCLNGSMFDQRRKVVRYKQAGRGGIGTVIRDKKLKAVVARTESISLDKNAPAEKDRVRKVGRAHSSEVRELDPKQNEMAVVGTTHIVTIMNDHDLLPTNNFQYGSHPDAVKIGDDAYRERFDPGFDGCWKGCTVACSHCVKDYVPKTGPYKGQKVWVDGPEYETIAGCGSNWGIYDPDFIVEVNFYADTYGLDTISLGTALGFVMECYERGLINKTHTGDLEIKFGNKEAALEVIHQMARNEGFGKIVGQGIRRMKMIFAEKFGLDEAGQKLVQDIGMEAKGLEFSEYMTKESLAQQGGYGLALKGPQHDEAWLIFEDMVRGNLPTFEDKAEALAWFPFFRTWFGLNGLCKLPWNDVVPFDNNENPLKPLTLPNARAKIPKHVNWYAEYFSATTGREATPEDLIKISEVVYNFQRIFNLRQGFGRREHDAIPYRSVGPVTKEEYESRAERYDTQLKINAGFNLEGKSIEEKIIALRKYREAEYERLKDAVYKRRGWTNNGVVTLDKAKELGIDFPEVVKLLKKHQ
ncbi:MAG: aldehyde ferredoxin oxidoreductase family protein [Promethearchaeota archaeon]